VMEIELILKAARSLGKVLDSLVESSMDEE
jgi:hypothetical protein